MALGQISAYSQSLLDLVALALATSAQISAANAAAEAAGGGAYAYAAASKIGTAAVAVSEAATAQATAEELATEAVTEPTATRIEAAIAAATAAEAAQIVVIKTDADAVAAQENPALEKETVAYIKGLQTDAYYATLSGNVEAAAVAVEKAEVAQIAYTTLSGGLTITQITEEGVLTEAEEDEIIGEISTSLPPTPYVIDMLPPGESIQLAGMSTWGIIALGGAALFFLFGGKGKKKGRG